MKPNDITLVKGRKHVKVQSITSILGMSLQCKWHLNLTLKNKYNFERWIRQRTFQGGEKYKVSEVRRGIGDGLRKLGR